MVEAHFLRKPGQSDINPATGEDTVGQFESWTRFELMDPNYKTTELATTARDKAHEASACRSRCVSALPLASPAYATCSSCNIQSKTPSASAPGKFDYRVSCIVDESGENRGEHCRHRRD